MQLLEYADDVDVMALTHRAVNEALADIETEAAKMGLAMNEGRTKYTLSTRMDAQRRLLDGKSVAFGLTKAFAVARWLFYSSQLEG